MSDAPTETTIENYKGILQEYCHTRNLGNPIYESVQHGSPNEPSWNVTVKYGQSTYTTPEPIRGTKRLAEQITAKQILETIESRQEAFLAGESIDQDASTKGIPAIAETNPERLVAQVEAPQPEVLYIPIELITSALGIANHRLAESRRGTRFREPPESKNANQTFAQNLADLTMMIVREVAKAAKAANIEFISPKAERSSS